jgi:cytochrome c553
MRSRLGDDIDDFCVKCKRVMNHLVVSLLNDEPAKVRCRTCHGDHDFRHEQAPPPKIDARKAALIQQALEKAAAAAGGADGLVDGLVDGLANGEIAPVAALPEAASVEPLPLPATPARKAARSK